MRIAAYAIAFSLVSAPTMAGSTCQMTLLCAETEACVPADLTLRFRAGTGGPNDIELDVGDEVVPVAVGGNARVAHLAGLTQRGFHVLTLAQADGTARYTRHIDADGPEQKPVALTWHGTCELGE